MVIRILQLRRQLFIVTVEVSVLPVVQHNNEIYTKMSKG